MPYDTEKELFEVAINTPFVKELYCGESSCKLIEPKGLFGVPDLLIVNWKKEEDGGNGITFIAFEMKLRDWKRALAQAFRYRAFANISYVVLDHQYANPALRNLKKFQRSNIGLVSIDGEGQVYLHFEPSIDEPYSSIYKNQLLEILQSL